MSSLVTRATESTIRSGTLESLSTTIGLTAVVLLIILLVERELIRAVTGAHAAMRLRALSIASVPLLVTAIAVIGSRLASLR